MMFYENLKMAFVSLRNAKLRSFLTMLGIIIGVAAVVSILAIGAGVKKAVQDQITGVVNANAIAVASGKIDLKGGKAGNAASSLGASTLTLADIDALSQLGHIRAVAPMSLISGNVSTDTVVSNNELLLATTPPFSQTQTLKFAAGRFLESSDNGQRVVVLGGGAKQDLFGSGDAIGRQVTIRSTRFTVIGVLKASDAGASSFSAGPSLENAVYLPFDTATKVTGSAPPIARILVQVDNSTNVATVASAMKTTMLAGHGGQEDFTVLTQKDILTTVDSILSLLTTFIVAIATNQQ